MCVHVGVRFVEMKGTIRDLLLRERFMVSAGPGPESFPPPRSSRLFSPEEEMEANGIDAIVAQEFL